MKKGVWKSRGCVLLLLVLAGCSYVRHATRQAQFAAEQWTEPRQYVYKHLVNRETFFVFGQILGSGVSDPVAVVAISDQIRKNEVVDVNYTSRLDSYYGLNLPAGRYRLAVVHDGNRDGLFDESEILGYGDCEVGKDGTDAKVLGRLDLKLNGKPMDGALAFKVEVKEPPKTEASLFYPKGSIRRLDDPIFSEEQAELGLYEPAAFLERAPMMFYALEEDQGYKVPVIFVHGIAGSPRDFEAILAKLDRRIYRPWFFYYPSGRSLSQLGEMFYDIFLSGDVIPAGDMPLVIVAHSMGGLVVREAMNRFTGRANENHVRALITLASPLGGHPSAGNAAKAPAALPSWRDLNPESPFIRKLHRKPLPSETAYALLYAFRNDSTVKLGANSDGVVPLSSQLAQAGQKEAVAQRGFDDTHTGILNNPEAIREVLTIVSRYRSDVTEPALKVMLEGGYDVPLSSEYSPLERYAIRCYGGYLRALTRGELEPTRPEERHFVENVHKRSATANPFETGWLRFVKDYPDYFNLPLIPVEIPPLRGRLEGKVKNEE